MFYSETGLVTRLLIPGQVLSETVRMEVQTQLRP